MQRHDLFEQLKSHFGERDLKILCFKLGIRFSNLPGDTFDLKAKSLIEYQERRGGLDELEMAIRNEIEAGPLKKFTNLFLPVDVISIVAIFSIVALVVILALVIFGAISITGLMRSTASTPAQVTENLEQAALNPLPLAADTPTFPPPTITPSATPTFTPSATPTITPTPTPFGWDLPYYLFVIDGSARMTNQDVNGQTKWNVAQSSLLSLVTGKLPPNANYSLLLLGSNQEGEPLTCADKNEMKVPFTLERERVSTEIFGYSPQGEVSLQDGLTLALNELLINNTFPEGANKILVIVLGGGDNCSEAGEWQSLINIIQTSPDLFIQLNTELIILADEEVDAAVRFAVDELRELVPEQIQVSVANPADTGAVEDTFEAVATRVIPTPTPIRVRLTQTDVPTIAFTPTSTSAPTQTPILGVTKSPTSIFLTATSNPTQTATPNPTQTATSALPTQTATSIPTLTPVPEIPTNTPTSTYTPTPTNTPLPPPFIVDNFNDGTDPNQLEGIIEWFVPDEVILPTPEPPSPTPAPIDCSGVSATKSYDGSSPIGGSGFSQLLTYNGITDICYAAWQTGLLNNDFTQFRFVSLQIKGSIMGCENDLDCYPNIYLQRSSTERSWVDIEKYIGGQVTNNWQLARIPLVDFLNNPEGTLPSLTNLDFFQVVFEWGNFSGTINIDNIQFEH